jgi:hypothetical protein
VGSLSLFTTSISTGWPRMSTVVGPINLGLIGVAVPCASSRSRNVYRGAPARSLISSCSLRSVCHSASDVALVVPGTVMPNTSCPIPDASCIAVCSFGWVAAGLIDNPGTLGAMAASYPGSCAAGECERRGVGQHVHAGDGRRDHDERDHERGLRLVDAAEQAVEHEASTRKKTEPATSATMPKRKSVSWARRLAAVAAVSPRTISLLGR